MNQSRVYWLDVARAIAIFLVVFTHIHERIGVNSILIKGIFYDIDRLGVPLFFMISGGLILPKLTNINIVVFYKKRVPQFLLVLVLYSMLTTLIYKITNGVDFSKAIKDSILLHNGIYPASNGNAHQLWFMYSIIQLYLIAPFLAKLLENLTDNEILLFLIFSIILTQFKFTFNIDFLKRLGTNFIGEYVNFFILGYLFIYRNKRINLIISIILLVIPILLSLWYEAYKGEFINSLHWYSSSLQILISSIGLINLIRNLFTNAKSSRFVEYISRYSFGIYLSHYLFIYLFLDVKNYINSLTGKIIILIIPTLIASYLFTHFLSKNKITQKLVM
ncbi:MAG: acyltransferase [[Pasteurella] mairii]|nr:acyltransferase [[Pasteurella] mairii]